MKLGVNKISCVQIHTSLQNLIVTENTKITTTIKYTFMCIINSRAQLYYFTIFLNFYQ